jgi:hypothetical protein
MGWFPPITHHFRRIPKAQNPHQLSKIQKRTQRFKSGDVHRVRMQRESNIIPPIPNQASIRLDETPPSSSSALSTSLLSPLEKALMKSDFLSKVEQMKVLTDEQKEELIAEAVREVREPRICVDRGVMAFELSPEEAVIAPCDVDLNPAAVSVTLHAAHNWKRSVSIAKLTPVYGVKEDKPFVVTAPFKPVGLDEGHISKIMKSCHSIFKKIRNKALFGSDADEIARKASKLNLSPSAGTTKPSASNCSPSDGLPEGMDIDNLQPERPVTPGKKVTFAHDTPMNSGQSHKDLMDLSEFSDAREGA